MAPKLDDQAAEVMGMIVRYLAGKDLLALRSTCRVLQHQSFEGFAEAFFRTQSVLLARPSLQRLVDVSRLPVANYVRNLNVCAEVVDLPPEIEEEDGTWDTEMRFQTRRHYRQDQQYVLNYGLDIAMLAAALTNLPNLETIEMHGFVNDSYEKLHYSGVRLGWGSKTVARELAGKQSVTPLPYTMASMTRAMTATLSALLTSSSSIRLLAQMSPMDATSEGNVHISVFNLPTMMLQSMKASTAFRSLRQIELRIRTDDDDGTNPASECGLLWYDEDSEAPSWLPRFLLAIPALEKVGINLCSTYNDEAHCQVIEGLSIAMTETPMPNLKYFKLQNATYLHSATLSRFLQAQARTLRTVIFEDVGMLHTWDEVWRQLLRMPELKKLHLSELDEAGGQVLFSDLAADESAAAVQSIPNTEEERHTAIANATRNADLASQCEYDAELRGFEIFVALPKLIRHPILVR
ncbi:hypothetical protein B0A49_12688 [Cryomyces minteri]|uniref:F-box domain-containing protein n=1 Tax=Cryomyces minteri TaxID=331657 RepID=A0A4U0WGD1_9PEZI|nr:hypothetical protein B0A49_12688 [Cryomyces minteri]